jgi:hypothetical protein
MYEHRSQAPITHRQFIRRLLAQFLVVLALLAVSLGIGMYGYSHFEQLAPIDAFENSAMLLGGMGPIHEPVTFAGKLFAGCYALYAGLVFIVAAALIFSPLVHRVLHRFHWDSKS